MKVSAPQVVLRVAGGLLGSYAFAWGFVTLLVAALLVGGMPYDEALTLAYLLAFLVLLVVFCWSFVAASLARVWLVLAGGGAAMTAAAWLLAGTVQ
jgi:hypothetical protein